MYTKRSSRLMLPLIVLLLAAMACEMPQLTSSESEAGTQTMDALASIVAGTMGPDGSGDVQATVEATAGEADGESGEEPTETPEIVHVTSPSSPAGADSWMTDRSSRDFASQRTTVADNFDFNLLERPFTSQEMDYQAYLDITRAEWSAVSPWVYVTIFLEEAPPDPSTAEYGVEIDVDLDGRGDWVVFGMVPSGTEWTTDNVLACRDTNNDVGGTRAIRADPPSSTWNGYDDCVFESGLGNDPDTAWIRRDPSDPTRVQLAFKHSLIGSDDELLWGAWADDGVHQLAMLDYNDMFTPQDAGSPLNTSSLYPINELYSVDNSCRWTYDFSPIDNLPGMCPLPPTPTPTFTPTATPEPARVSGYIFADLNLNGVRNAGEFGLSGWTVRIGAGACSSTGLGTTSSSSSGYYAFTNLPAGTYCISVQFNSSCGGWGTNSTHPRTITLSPGENLTYINFGFWQVIC
jgi:hypothetical protein